MNKKISILFAIALLAALMVTAESRKNDRKPKGTFAPGVTHGHGSSEEVSGATHVPHETRLPNQSSEEIESRPKKQPKIERKH